MSGPKLLKIEIEHVPTTRIYMVHTHVLVPWKQTPQPFVSWWSYEMHSQSEMLAAELLRAANQHQTLLTTIERLAAMGLDPMFPTPDQALEATW